jgi:hypothetical protein
MASRNERGELNIKAILFLVVLVYGVFMALKLIPARADDGEMQHKAEEITKFYSTREGAKDEKGLHYLVWHEAERLNLPKAANLKEEDVLAKDEGREWHVSFTYHREIPLILWVKKYDVKIDARGQK